MIVRDSLEARDPLVARDSLDAPQVNPNTLRDLTNAEVWTLTCVLLQQRRTIWLMDARLQRASSS